MIDQYAAARTAHFRERLAEQAEAGLARARARSEGPAVISLAEAVVANARARAAREAQALEDAVSAALDEEV